MHQFFDTVGWGEDEKEEDAELVGFSLKQQQAFQGSTGSVNIWDGSVRSGKTFTWAWMIIAIMAVYDGSAAVVIAGKNRDSIYRNVFEPIETHAIFAAVRGGISYRQGAPTAKIFGRTVHIIGANDAGSENKIRGMTIGLAFADEITILHKTFVKQLLSRLSKKSSRLYATTNPDSQNHWLRKDYLVRVPGSPHFDPKTPEKDLLSTWTYWHFTMDDNPSLSEEFKERIRREYTGLWYKRFILGLWVSADGAIYDMWDEAKHMVAPEDMPPIERVLGLGIDYGTTHPTVGELLGVGSDNKLYILDEWLPGRKTDADLSADLRRQLADWEAKGWSPEWIYVDPAAASFRMQLREDGHPRLRAAKNDVLDGIRTVASLLNNGELFISSTCTQLREELPGYRWDDKAKDRGVEKPIKENDDGADSLRYAVFSTRWEWSRILNRELEPTR